MTACAVNDNPILAHYGVTLEAIRNDEALLRRVQFQARVAADMPLITTLSELSRFQLENSRYSITRTWYARGESTHVVVPSLSYDAATTERDRLQAIADAADPRKPFGRLLYSLQREIFKVEHVTETTVA